MVLLRVLFFELFLLLPQHRVGKNKYVFFLQLDSQMLALRNGLSLHPMSLPEVVPPMQLPLPETLFSKNEDGHEFQNANSGICKFPMGEESSLLSTYHASNPCTNLKLPIVIPSDANTTNLEDSIGFEQFVWPHYRSLNLATSSKVTHSHEFLK